MIHYHYSKYGSQQEKSFSLSPLDETCSGCSCLIAHAKEMENSSSPLIIIAVQYSIYRNTCLDTFYLTHLICGYIFSISSSSRQKCVIIHCSCWWHIPDMLIPQCSTAFCYWISSVISPLVILIFMYVYCLKHYQVDWIHQYCLYLQQKACQAFLHQREQSADFFFILFFNLTGL